MSKAAMAYMTGVPGPLAEKITGLAPTTAAMGAAAAMTKKAIAKTPRRSALSFERPEEWSSGAEDLRSMEKPFRSRIHIKGCQAGKFECADDQSAAEVLARCLVRYIT